MYRERYGGGEREREHKAKKARTIISLSIIIHILYLLFFYLIFLFLNKKNWLLKKLSLFGILQSLIHVRRNFFIFCSKRELKCL